VRIAALVAAVVVLAGCGGEKRPSPQVAANTALLDTVPVYPGSAGPKTTPGEAFGARDWTLPAGAVPNRVIDWYVSHLQAGGWNVSGKSFNTIRATRAGRSVSIGVRKRTLEVIANA
jgi:fermentation-respiration switch protein FrsA (DUF1100 family)